MYLDRLGKKLGRLFGFSRTRTEVRKLFLLLQFKSLTVDSVCDTSHVFQVTFVALQLLSKVVERA